MQKIDKVQLFEGITYINPVFVEEASVPLPKRYTNILWLRKAGALAASFAFAATVLLSINAAFPAFAESLPFVGGMFRQLNALGTNAPSYDGLVQSIDESAENNQYKVTVTETYCDGEYVFFTLRLQPKDTKLLKMELLQTEETAGNDTVPGWSITLNGESGGLNYALPVFTRKGPYFESNPIQVTLPDGTEQDTLLHVEVMIGNLAGRTSESIDLGETGQIVSLEPIHLAFDLTANTGYNQQGIVHGAETDGLSLQSWSCSPSKLSVTLAYPYFGMDGVSVSAYTDDGVDLGEDLREFGDFGDGRYTFGDTAIQKCAFIGPPDNTKKVIVTVYKEQPWERTNGTSVFGEFTILLETGEVTITSNYLDEGFEYLPLDAYAGGKITETESSTAVPGCSPVPPIY